MFCLSKIDAVIDHHICFPQRFSGNTNRRTRVTNMFIEEIRARYIRITPTGYYQRPGMRIELLGCNGKVITKNKKNTIIYLFIDPVDLCNKN